MDYFLVDYESYDPDNIKEFSIFGFTTQEVETFYIKTKKPNIKNYNWLVEHWHHIPYKFGNTPFRQIIKILNKPNCVFYIKGLEKRNNLQRFTKNHIRNLEDFNCPRLDSFEKSQTFCFFHTNCPTQHCATVKLFKILDWIKNKNDQPIPIRDFEASIKL